MTRSALALKAVSAIRFEARCRGKRLSLSDGATQRFAVRCRSELQRARRARRVQASAGMTVEARGREPGTTSVSAASTSMSPAASASTTSATSATAAQVAISPIERRREANPRTGSCLRCVKLHVKPSRARFRSTCCVPAGIRAKIVRHHRRCATAMRTATPIYCVLERPGRGSSRRSVPALSSDRQASRRSASPRWVAMHRACGRPDRDSLCDHRLPIWRTARSGLDAAVPSRYSLTERSRSSALPKYGLCRRVADTRELGTARHRSRGGPFVILVERLRSCHLVGETQLVADVVSSSRIDDRATTAVESRRVSRSVPTGAWPARRSDRPQAASRCRTRVDLRRTQARSQRAQYRPKRACRTWHDHASSATDASVRYQPTPLSWTRSRPTNVALAYSRLSSAITSREMSFGHAASHS